MQQQQLQLQIPPSYDYGRWVRHSGAEAASNRLATWLVYGGRLWLTSEAPAGKTHLLHSMHSEYPHLGWLTIGAADAAASPYHLVREWARQLGDSAFWLLDVSAGDLPRSTALALFHLMERAREAERHLLLGWRSGAESNMPPELSSRLKTLERVEISSPQRDEELLAVLRSRAADMQWDVADGVLEAMLKYLPRTLSAQLAALQSLETLSLAEGKRVTPARARLFFQQQGSESSEYLGGGGSGHEGERG